MGDWEAVHTHWVELKCVEVGLVVAVVMVGGAGCTAYQLEPQDMLH